MKSKTIIIFVILFILGNINICLSSNPAEQVSLVFITMAINRIRHPNTAKELEKKAKMGKHIYAYRIDSGNHFVDMIEFTKEFVKEANIIKKIPLSEEEMTNLNNLYNSLSVNEKNIISSMSKCAWEVMSKFPEEVMNSFHDEVINKIPEEIMDNSNKTNIYKKGDTVNIGNWSVKVECWRLSSECVPCENNHVYFPVEITNESNKSSYPPLFRLEDEYGNEFDLVQRKVKVYKDSDIFRLNDISLDSLKKIQPSLSVTKALVFDVPKNRHYLLKVYDNQYDYKSKEFVFIDYNSK